MGDIVWIIRHSEVETRNETHAGFSAIKHRFEALNPKPAQQAGAGYEAAADELAEKARLLSDRHAPALIEAWGGPAAQKAIERMQKIHAATIELANQSFSAAQNLNWYGDEILSWYKDLGNSMSDGDFSTESDNKEARRLMNKLNLRAAEVQKNYPEQVTYDLIVLNQDNEGTSNDPGGPGGPSDPKGRPPKGDPFGKIPDNRNPNPDLKSPRLPSGDGGLVDGGRGTNLAGFTPPGGGLSSGGLDGGLLGGDPFGMVAGAGSGAGVDGASGAGGSAAGGSGAAAGVGGALGNRAAGGVGGGLMPMSGGHAQREESRERTAWLSEDADVWGGGEDAVPGQIG